MRMVRRAIQATDTLPVQLPTESAYFDSNSTATVTVMGSLSVVKLFSPFVIPQAVATSIEIEHLPSPAAQDPPLEIATVNSNLLLASEVEEARRKAAEVFVAARPHRKRLFEMKFTIPRGGLPRRKPFVWIPESQPEE